MTYCLEGDFIELRDGSFFEVKGFDHPKNGVIAFPRYVPLELFQRSPQFKNLLDTEGIILRSLTPESDAKYVKITSLSSKFEVLSQLYPDISLSHPHYSFPIPQVPAALIVRHLQPENFFISNLASKHSQSTLLLSDSLEENSLKPALEFLQLLAEETSSPLENFGITGSTLLGLHLPTSDLDLIVYGYATSLKVRDFLYKCYNNYSSSHADTSSHPISPYTSSQLHDLYLLRVPSAHIPFFQFAQYELRKLHQGWYKDHEFFIRFLEFSSREKYAQKNQFSHQKIHSLGRITCSAQVIGDYHWWTTPASVSLDHVRIDSILPSHANIQELLLPFGVKIQDISRTYTLRGRFTENVRLLEFVSIEGTLELVEPLLPSAGSYLQIVVGNHPQDKLMPK